MTIVQNYLRVSQNIIFVVVPNNKCRLKLLREERIKDYILME